MSDSFSDHVKYELVKKMSGSKSELAAVIRMKGSLNIMEKNLFVKMKFSYGELARKIYTVVKENYDLQCEIIVGSDNRLNQKYNYQILITPQSSLKNFLFKLGFFSSESSEDFLNFGIKKELVTSVAEKKAYLRGAFLGGGSVNAPQGEYHLEIRCEHQQHAEDLIELLEFFDLEGKINRHKAKSVLYLKSFSAITSFLNIIGASNAQLKMENVHTMKEVKSNVNRRVNAETANLDKTVRAAMDQLDAIRLIEKEKGLDKLTASLQEIAALRKENPYASLRELGQMLNPPLSKSGVNHRLRRIKKIASKLQ